MVQAMCGEQEVLAVARLARLARPFISLRIFTENRSPITDHSSLFTLHPSLLTLHFSLLTLHFLSSTLIFLL